MNRVALTAVKEWTLAWWQDRKPRERMALAWAAAVVIAAVLYAFVLTPAISGRQRLEKALPLLRAQAAEMEVLSKDAADVIHAGAAPAPAPTKDTIETSLRDKGLRAQSVVVDGGLARVQLTAASFSSLLQWLNEAQRSARLSVIDASIVAQPAPGTVNATLTLQQQKGE